MSQLARMNADQPEDQEKKPYTPECPLCQDQGFTGCPEAIAPNGWTWIVMAFQKGEPCTCKWGLWFREMRAKWFEEREQ